MWKIAIGLIALLPSIWMMWQAQGIPHLGHFHDDGIYAGTAKSIAEGKGLRVESLPGEPYQVKYPPLFPMYLALGVRWELALAILAWLPLPLLMYLVWIWRRDWLLVLMLGWNVFSVTFASTALSEIFATCLLLLTVQLLERDRIPLAGVCGGLSYLCRTSFVAVPAGAVAWLLWKRRWRDALIVSGIFLPFYLGWTYYVRSHTAPDIHAQAIYYLSYSRFYWENMDWAIAPKVLGTNFLELVRALGGVVFFNQSGGFWEQQFARLLLWGALAGLVRDVRRNGAGVYLFVAVLYSGLLTVWNFVPIERLVFPLLPLLLMGLLTELRHFGDMLKATWVTQRAATVILGAVVAAGCLWILHRNTVGAWEDAAGLASEYRQIEPEREKAYSWIRANTQPDENFLIYADTALRDRTGRHGMRYTIPTRYVYTQDHQAILAGFDEVIHVLPQLKIQYVVIGDEDFIGDLQAEDRNKMLENWRNRPDLETVYEGPRYMIRRYRNNQSGL